MAGNFTELRRDVEQLIKDPRTRFALDLLDPDLVGTVVRVPFEFRTPSNKSSGERHFWGRVHGRLCIALGVHHGVEKDHLYNLISDVAVFQRDSASLERLMLMLGADKYATQCFINFCKSRKATNHLLSEDEHIIINNALNIIAATAPVRYFSASDTKIYQVALLHLRSILAELHRIYRHSGEMQSYIEDAIKSDSRWEQIVLWTNLDGQIVANPLPAFFGDVVVSFVQKIFNSVSVNAHELPFIDRVIWNEDKSFGQMAIVGIDEQRQKESLKKGDSVGVTFPWANQSFSQLRSAFASRHISPE